MQLEAAHTRRRSAIGLTSLIDVVFILLLFFMLASSFDQWRSLSINAPAANKSSSASAAEVLRVSVDTQGAVRLNGELLPEGALEARVRSYLEKNADQAVVVQPDEDTGLQTLVAVLDRLTAVGVRRLNLSTQ